MDSEVNGCSHGDEWPSHYRGYRLHVNPEGDIWWQLYSGTERLFIDGEFDELVENLLELKRIGGRIRITEAGDVITKVEQEESSNRDYETIYVGQVDLQSTLVPEDEPEYGIDISPNELSEGDLWPSVYDGARYSFVGDQIWWQNPKTHRRHYLRGNLNKPVMQALRRFKPDGGSFRITPQGDVITLIPYHPTPELVEEQFGDLPVVVRNIIKIRKEKGVEMLPVYIGEYDGQPIEVGDATTLSDSLTDSEQDELESWAKGLGRSTTTSKSNHSVDGEPRETKSTESEVDSSATTNAPKEDTPEPSFDDDPIAQIRNEVEEIESHSKEHANDH